MVRVVASEINRGIARKRRCQNCPYRHQRASGTRKINVDLAQTVMALFVSCQVPAAGLQSMHHVEHRVPRRPGRARRNERLHPQQQRAADRRHVVVRSDDEADLCTPGAIQERIQVELSRFAAVGGINADDPRLVTFGDCPAGVATPVMPRNPASATCCRGLV
jgi:hypothetical protein